MRNFKAQYTKVYKLHLFSLYRPATFFQGAGDYMFRLNIIIPFVGRAKMREGLLSLDGDINCNIIYSDYIDQQKKYFDVVSNVYSRSSVYRGMRYIEYYQVSYQ